MGMSRFVLPGTLAAIVVAAAGYLGGRAATEPQPTAAMTDAPSVAAGGAEAAGSAPPTAGRPREAASDPARAAAPPAANPDTGGLSVGLVIPGKATLGEPAPPFALVTPDDGIIALADFKGRPVVLNFFATWCVPCRAEMPLFQRAHEIHAAAGLAVVGIDLEEDGSVVRPFLEELGLSFPVGLDRHGAVSDAYRVGTLPTTYFIDAAGDVATRRIGVYPSEAELEAALRQILPAADGS